MRHPSFVALVAFAVASCGRSGLPDFDQCVLNVTLSAESGARGDTIVATGGEFSVDYDTVVLVDATSATVIDVERENCAFCDGCREAIEPPCDACEECVGCEQSCLGCVQTVTFVVPNVTPGATAIVLTNRFGTSDAIPFTVLEGDSP